MMDSEDIDENMTVPHPSIHSTSVVVAAASTISNTTPTTLRSTAPNDTLASSTTSNSSSPCNLDLYCAYTSNNNNSAVQQDIYAAPANYPPVTYQQQQQHVVESSPFLYQQQQQYQEHSYEPQQQQQLYEQQANQPIYNQQHFLQDQLHLSPHTHPQQQQQQPQHFQQHPHLHLHMQQQQQPQPNPQQQQQMLIQQAAQPANQMDIDIQQLHHHLPHQQQQQQHFSPSPTNQQQQQQQQQQMQQSSQVYMQQQTQPSTLLTSEQQSPLAVHERLVSKLDVLNQQSISNGNKLKSLCHFQENFVLAGHERGSIYAMKEKSKNFKVTDQLACELKEREDKLRQMSNELRARKERLLADFSELFTELSQLQSEVLFRYLPEWHLNQQLALNGTPLHNHNLDHIQHWCELITDIFWRTRNQLKAFHLFIKSLATSHQNSPAFHKINQLGFAINRAIETHVLNTLVVEKQPPQVMKTNTRFSSTIRLLSGSKLNISLINPTIKVNILSEANARSIKKRHQELIAQSWAFLGDQQQQQQQASPQHQPVSSNNNNHHHQMDYSSTQSSQQPSESVPSSTYHLRESPPTTTSPFSCQTKVESSNFQQQSSPHHQQHYPTSSVIQQQQVNNNNTNHLHQYPQQQQQQQQHLMQTSNDNSVLQYSKNKILNMKTFEPSGEIFNSNALLEYNELTRQACGHFKNMQLKKIKRPEKKGTESVTDEKFILLFHSQFRIADLSNNDVAGFGMQANSSSSDLPWLSQGDMIFHLMAFSLPVVVIVHGNQEPHAWATVTWHNAFARPDHILYHVPDTVYWHELGKIFSDKFRTNAGKGLSQENINYLGSKVCRTNIENEKQLVTWSQFSKEPLPEKTFTFWEWFHSVLKLTKEHLRNLWNADRIYGFIGKKGCVELLLGNSNKHEPKQIGTFLLRYSETELGGITIAWVSSPATTTTTTQNSIKGEDVQVYQRHSPTSPTSNVLMHIQPFGNKDLNTRSLADRIRDLENLIYLYPDIPKDEAFSAYYTPINGLPPLPDDYVQPMLIQTLVTNYVNNSNSNPMDIALTTPTTPNSFSQSSDGIC